MNFLKKAQAQMKELEGDINNAMATVKLGDSGSQSSSTRPKSNVKLPLTTRKNVRDYYDPAKPEAEAKISASLGVPWVFDIDIGMIYEISQLPETQSRQARENLGRMLAEYTTGAVQRLNEFVAKYGQDGVQELNTVAPAHAFILEQGEGTINGKTTCDIYDGCVRILFEKGHLGFNISQALTNIGKAVNDAGKTAGDGGPTLSFDAKSGISKDYDPKIPQVKAKLEQLINLPGGLTLKTDFNDIYAKVTSYQQTHGLGTNHRPGDFEKRLGMTSFNYFDGLATQLGFAGFAKDDMLQEGFQEAVSKNTIELRVVDKLVKKKYSEIIIEDGTLYMQTTAEHWGSNVNQTGEGLVDLL